MANMLYGAPIPGPRKASYGLPMTSLPPNDLPKRSAAKVFATSAGAVESYISLSRALKDKRLSPSALAGVHKHQILEQCFLQAAYITFTPSVCVWVR